MIVGFSLLLLNSSQMEGILFLSQTFVSSIRDLCYAVTKCVNEFENEKIIGQFAGIIKCCDQSGDRVSKNDKIYHIYSILGFNVVLGKSLKIWDSVYSYPHCAVFVG